LPPDCAHSTLAAIGLSIESSPVRVALISLILFLSGCSALLFETLWLRISGFVFGNSVWSAALILSSFMAGLAVGSAIAARWKRRVTRPLRVYATLEMIIAIFGCALVLVLPVFGAWLRPLFQTLWTHQELINVLRFTFSFLVLLVPTTAMGLVLPVLMEDSALGQYEFTRTISFSYACNTLGAVAGSLLGEAVLIQTWGLFGTALAAGAICCFATSLAVTGSIQSVTSTADIPVCPKTKTLPRRLLFVSAGTGLTFLALEVVWFRFLRLYVTSSSIAFSVMLAVVLAGISFGGILSTLIPTRLRQDRQLLSALLFIAAIATLLSYLFFPIPAAPWDKTSSDIWSWRQIGLLSLTLMFPVAFLSGILLPTLVASVQSHVIGRMNSAGLTILWNTIGAACGPLLASFIFLPRFGFQTSLIACAMLYTALAVLASARPSWRPQVILPAALGAVFVLILSIFPYHRDESHLANARRPYQRDGSVFVRKIEGTADTFQLLRRDLAAGPYYYRLVTNSYSMSATQPRSQRYMRLFSYLPLAFRPQSEDALLVCYGVGVTADAFVRNRQLKHLDIVDISKEVFDLADSYSEAGYSNPLRDSRVTTFVQDGRFFLQSCPNHYDVITGEPPPLKMLGTVNLYTEQFFRLIKDRLKDGGVASYWLPLYQITLGDAKSILRAFHNVFPDASLWATSDLEWIMIGIKPPLPRPNEELASQLWIDPGTGNDLRRIGVEEPGQMSALFLMDGDEIGRLVKNVEPLDDFHPKRLSDGSPDPDAAFKFGFNYMQRHAALERFSSSPLIREVWPNTWQQSLALFFGVRETRFQSEMSGSNWLAEMDVYLRYTKLRAPVLAAQDTDDFRVALAEKAANESPGSLAIETRRDLIAGAVADRNFDHAIDLLEQENKRGFHNANDLFLLIYLYCVNGQIGKAEALAAAKNSAIQKDWFVEWLWGDLQAEFGFRPPG
jgi:predicted membrane-bound spermidine synthase